MHEYRSDCTNYNTRSFKRIGKSVKIWSQKLKSSWPVKLGFSLKPLSNPSLTGTHVGCVMNVIIGL